MRKEKETTIDGKKLKVTQLGFEDGIDLISILYKSLGPSIGAMLSGIDKKPKEDLGSADISMDAVSNALGELAKRLNAADLKHVVYTLAKTTRIEREPGKWPTLEPEVDLAGDYWLMFKWLAFALEVNYGSFLGGAGLAAKVAGVAQTIRRAQA